MNKKVICRILSALFTLCLIVVLAAPTFATEVDIAEPASEHEHVWNFDGYSFYYTENDEDTHYVEKVKIEVCSCGFIKATTIYKISEDHSIANYFTGNHFHIINREMHTAEYEQKCEFCEESFGTIWNTYTCPGNGACIAP